MSCLGWIDENANWLCAAITVGLLVTKTPLTYNGVNRLNYRKEQQVCAGNDVEDVWVVMQIELNRLCEAELLRQILKKAQMSALLPYRTTW